MTRHFAASPGKFRVPLFFAAFLAVAMLAASPANAAHFIATETVFECQDCRLSNPYIDVSRGYPILLATVGRGENLEETTGLLMIRPLGPAAASQGVISLAGEGSRWNETRIGLGADTFEYVVVNTGGACGGELTLNECIAILYIYINQDNQATAQSHELTLDGKGNITGSLSCGESLVPGLTGAPSWLDAMITPDGNTHVAWWGQSGLNYTNQQGVTWLNDPVLLAADDDNGWPTGSTPPTGMGYSGDDNKPFVVTDTSPDGFIEAFTYNIDDSTPVPYFVPVTVAVPEDVVDVDATIEPYQGGGVPAATLVTEDNIVRYDDLLKADPLTYEDPEDKKKKTDYAVIFSAGNRRYNIYCDIDGRLMIQIAIYHGDPVVDVDVGYVVVDEDFAGSTLVGARRAEDGTIHICVKNQEQQNAKNESFDWIEVTIDEGSIDWE